MSTRRAKSGRFDAKQVVCTVIGGVFGVGLIFLVGLHIGKNVGPETVAEASAVPPTAESIVSVTGELPGPQDFGFFALLDAPAPRRELRAIELPINPKLEEKKHKKEDVKVAEDVAAVVESKSKKAEKKQAKLDQQKSLEASEPTEHAQAIAPVAEQVASADQAPMRQNSTNSMAGKPVDPFQEEPAAKAEETLTSGVSPAEQVERALQSKSVSSSAERSREKVSKSEKTPKAKEKKAEKPSKTQGRFTVQVSAFQDKSVASTMAEELEASGLKAYVKKESVPGKGAWYRVQVGRYESREEAQSAQGKIKSRQGYDGFVTSN
ncbi:MAG: hypothetical protein AUK47_17180 [Deltaproteobacteria bacterium CG2_30_63_29]|nr:MAG: hypothetical protein AUK47_17180 [Deltaproteobacteria bacterium CG2_30_63_29]PJB46011.1 MAG: hypothetical protein CO108_06425 [Deltaproteobacteria bacterium CG_4_9_14_3_um_filter_63_12]